MKNTVTLNRNCDFRRLYGRGKVYTDPALVIYLLKNRAGNLSYRYNRKQKDRQRRTEKSLKEDNQERRIRLLKKVFAEIGILFLLREAKQNT